MFDELERDMEVNSIRALIPGMIMQPQLIVEAEQACQRLLVPWDKTVAEEDNRDYDQLYHDNIGRFKDDEKEDV